MRKMKYAIFYFSPCGGTKSVADIISKELGDAPMQEITTPSMNVALDNETLAFFCFPVYGGRIPKPMYDRMDIIKGNNTPCVPVAVYGNRAVDDALLEMSDLAAKQGFVTVAGCSMIAPHSIDPSFGAGRPDASDKAKLIDFLKKLKEKDSFAEVQTSIEARLFMLGFIHELLFAIYVPEQLAAPTIPAPLKKKSSE